MSSLEDTIKSDVFHQLISENASDLISILNNKYEYEYIIEKPYHDILGYSKEDLIGRNAWELVHPEDIKRMLETYRLSTEKFLGIQEVYKEELRIRHKNGHYIWIESHNKPFLNEQGEMKLFLISRDISERKEIEQAFKESEEKFSKAFYNNSTIMAISTIEDGRYIDVNESFLKTLGYRKEEVIGKTSFDLDIWVDPGVRDRTIQVFNKQKGHVKNVEISIRKKSGEIAYGLFSADLIELKDKPLLITMMKDITDRKHAELKLKESEKKYREAYERANLYKDLFSHDMSNIINIINGSIELYSMFKNRPEEFSRREDLLENLSTSINKAKRLISNVRTLSQIEEGVEISLENVDILKFLDEAIQFTHDSFHQREIPIKVDSPLDSIFVPSNALLLDVFENILNNAVKYNNNPIVEITVRISKEHEEGKEYIKMEFIDNGIGIPDERKNFIFQRGYSDIKGGKGLGFGLSIVKKVTELYNGKLWVEDRVEGDYSKGSNFIIVLPKEL